METKTLQAKVRKFEEEERQLNKIVPLLAMVISAEEEIPKLEVQKTQAEGDVARQRAMAEARDRELADCREKLSTAQQIRIQPSSRPQEIRNLEDQLRKMDMNADLQELQTQLDGIQCEGSDNKELMREYEELTGNSAELNNKIQRMSGEHGQIEKKIKEIKQDMGSSRFAEARKNYTDKMVERCVISTAIEVRLVCHYAILY